MKLLYWLIFPQTIALAIFICLFSGADHILSCLFVNTIILIGYPAIMIKSKITKYNQTTFVTLPYSKTQLLILRYKNVLLSPENIVLCLIAIAAICLSLSGFENKLLVTILFIMQNVISMAFCVILENTYSNKNAAIRNSTQYTLSIGLVLNILVTRQIGADSLWSMSVLWWCATVGLSIATAALYPFAKRWIL